MLLKNLILFFGIANLLSVNGMATLTESGFGAECFQTIPAILTRNLNVHFVNSEEMDMTTAQIIAHRGYPVAEYLVETEDGYFVGIQRIINEGKPAILMQHGLTASASQFISSSTNLSMAFWFWEHGYDIWLSNVRGSLTSRKHKSLNPDGSSKYWSFSMHEFGIYDLPANIKYIRTLTNQEQIFYIGHSQGTMMFYVGMSKRPELNLHIKAAFLIGSAGAVGNMNPIFKAFCGSMYALQLGIPASGNVELVLPKEINHLLGLFCSTHGITVTVCQTVGNAILGLEYKRYELSTMGTFAGHISQGFNLKSLQHICQTAITGKFAEFDYGIAGNLMKYRSITPPLYPVEKITAPIYTYCGTCDGLTTPKDCEIISKAVGAKMTVIPGYNHVSYILGQDDYVKVFEPIEAVMRSYAEPTLVEPPLP